VLVLPHVHPHDLHSVVVDPSGQAIGYDACEVLRGGVYVLARRHFVPQHVLVGLHKGSKASPEIGEIDDEPSRVELARLQDGSDPPVVAVEALALALGEPKLMCCGDDGVSCDLPHAGKGSSPSGKS
jgi:hypothetical protein